MIIPFLFNIFFFLLPFVFLPFTSELFEFNKMIAVYLFTIIIVAAWIFNSIRQQKFVFKRTILDIPFFLFLASQILATIFSIDRTTSIFGYYSRFNGGLLSTLSYTLLYWAYVSNVTKQSAQRQIKLILISGTIVSVWAILEHLGFSPSCLIIAGQANATCWVQDVQHRVFATLGQPNWLAAYLVLLLPLAWMSKNHIASIAMFSALLFTKSRSGLLGFLVAFLIFWLLTKKIKSFLFVLGYLSLAALLILLPKTSASTSPAGPALETGGTESGTLRQIVWQGAIDVWQHNPIVGTGVETFAYSYYWYRPAAHNMTSEWDFIYNKAHNEYLNLAATTGILGLGTYLLVIAAAFIIFFRTKSTALLAGFVGLLVTNFFGFSVVITSLFFFLYPAIAGALLQSESKVKNKKFDIQQKLFLISIVGVVLLALFSLTKYWLADYYFAKGRRANEQGNLALAESSLSRAIMLNPSVALYSDALSYTYVQSALTSDPKDTKQFEDISRAAIALSDQISVSSPYNVTLLKSRANLFLDLSSRDKDYLSSAQEVLEKLTDLAPTDPTVFYRLGLVSANQGDFTQASQYLKKALELKSDYENAKIALLYINKQLGQ